MEKFTVVIPTRDRAETLEATIRTCVRQTYENLEIIVSDNCSTDNTKQVVESFRDPRIRYIRPQRRLSMSGNFEFSLGHVTNGFVMFIGSDDGVMPGAVEYVKSIVDDYGVSAVACRQATYVWPDFPDRDIAGRLTFGGLRNDVEIRQSREWIDKTLSFQTSYCVELPSVYCGFVHKRIIDKAYKNGTYFRSITPDAYSAFATAVFVDQYAYSHRPFSIAGASVKSNGASALHAAGDDGEASKYYQENDIDLSDGFVNCPSYEVILAEAFAKLAQAFPDKCMPYSIDYAAMLRNAIAGTNNRTEEKVRTAAAVMAANFSITLEDCLQRPTRGKRIELASIARVFRALLGPSRPVAIERSAGVGVLDVNDAALVAHALSSKGRKETRVITTRKLVRQMIRRLLSH